MYEEFAKEGILYIRETYENGLVTEYIKPSEEVAPKETISEVAEIKEPDQNIAILEGIANLFEKIETMEEKQTSLEENQMAILEGLAGAYEAQGTDK